MTCKKKDLKLKQSRQLQSEIVTRTSEEMLKEVTLALNDKFQKLIDSPPISKTREVLLGLHENRKEKFFSS